MTDSESHLLTEEEIEALCAPIVLTEASGNWTASRKALDIVQKACSVDQDEAKKALSKRAIVVIPVSCASWAIRVGPHVGADMIDFSPPAKRENQHFNTTMNLESYQEISQFFRALEHGADQEGDWAIEHMNWATGDFKVHLEHDFRTISLTVIGLQFDSSAIESAFSDNASGEARELQQSPRAGGGRPRSAAWIDWIAELASFVHDNGFPEGIGSQGQETLIKGVVDSLAKRGLEGPARATVQSAAQAALDRHRNPES